MLEPEIKTTDLVWWISTKCGKCGTETEPNSPMAISVFELRNKWLAEGICVYCECPAAGNVLMFTEPVYA